MSANVLSIFIRSLARREEFTRVVAKELVERLLLPLYDFERFSITEEEALRFLIAICLYVIVCVAVAKFRRNGLIGYRADALGDQVFKVNVLICDSI